MRNLKILYICTKVRSLKAGALTFKISYNANGA